MNDPAIDRLIEETDSKYSLVIAVAKRARELTNDKALVDSEINKNVSIALREIDADKIRSSNSKH